MKQTWVKKQEKKVLKQMQLDSEIFVFGKSYNNLTTNKMKTVNFKQTGYGQWNVSTEHYGKTISIHFTDAPIYDLITSQEKGYKSAIKSLRNRIINHHKN